MQLDALATALETRADLKTLLEITERAKFNLLNSDLDPNVFNRTHQIIDNIARDAKLAIVNIEVEFDKMYRISQI